MHNLLIVIAKRICSINSVDIIRLLKVYSMRLLKIVPLEWGRHSRNIRELNAYKELGVDVVVIDKGKLGVFFKKRLADGFPIYDITTRPLGSKAPVLLNRYLSVLVWAYYVRKLKPDVIDGHNLMALQIGYLPYILTPKKKRPKFIYDSHEFELALVAHHGEKKARKVAKLEKYFMQRVAFSTMICDGIADEVQRIHSLNERPVVIRSTPDYWALDRAIVDKIRNEYQERLHISEDAFIVEYHGYIQEYRGLEEILEAIALVKDVYLVIIGDAQRDSYEKSIERKIVSLDISDRILRYHAMPLEKLKNYLAAVDCGLVMNNGDNPNYYFALPNKFFENIQAMNPVICSDLPEMAHIVNKYDIGILVPYGQPKEIAEAINKMRIDKEQYIRFKQNIIKAKEDLCWENEKKILKETFKEKILKE